MDEKRFRLLLDDLAAALEVVKAAREVRRIQDDGPAIDALAAALDKWSE